jgi:hypothetical protein
MSAEEAGIEQTEPDNLNVGLIATVTIVGALLVVAIAASLTALVRSEASRYGYEVGAFADLGTVQRLKAEQRAKLEAAPAFLDDKKTQISLPVDRAMAAVTADIEKDPNLATEVAAPQTAAVPAPTGAASPMNDPAKGNGAPEAGQGAPVTPPPPLPPIEKK